ncbi:uncharacterized protein LOC143589857 isoform X2 [Bidens hawaiensis]|uniref:uncharacterized protein LOC143589857 isoform X2 n=1 Tax=Bidens hawaiensis TaxID=980011 RepID=UPI00404B3D23
MSVPLFVLVNGVVSPTTVHTPPVTTLLQSHPGAYTIFRTQNNGSELVFYERHLRRLATSAKILYESSPNLLFKPETSSTLSSSSSSSLQQMKFLEWESKIPSFVNDSMTKAMPLALKERKGETELAFTSLVTGDEEDNYRRFDVYLHVSLYAPVVFGVKKNGARLAVVGRGRDVANAKYSDWVRIRKPLEKLRPPSTTELLLSNDGDQILEGCLTNFFVLSRKDNIEESAENKLLKNKYGYSLELQTAPISDGVLPGVVQEVVIEACLRIGIPIREVAPSWSKRHLWQEAFITNSLRLLQHVETIRVPSSWDSLSSKTWKEETWEEKQFEGPGGITAIIQEEVLKMAKLEGHSVKSFL